MALIKHDERYGPYMTANNAPAPYAATASQSNYGAFRAFSESLDDDISFTGLGAGTEQWVQIKLDAPIRIWAFRIACRTTVSAKDSGQVPKNFTVQGSTDGTNFVDIQSYTDMPWKQFTSWNAEILKYDWADAKKIEIACNEEYQYYRFLFGECQAIGTQKSGSMTPAAASTVKPTLIDLYQVEGEDSPEVTVTGIRITHGPDKVRYEAGADLDPTGLEVTADLSDGATQIITDYTLSGFNSAAAGQQTVTVAYQGHTATFAVTVYALTSISVTTPPAKTQYKAGEELDLIGMIVTATYSDGVREPVTEYTVSGFDSSVAGTCTVVVTYQGQSASFEVTVAEPDAPQGPALESLLNTIEGMEAVRNNVRNDFLTDAVAGVEWFTYAGKTCSTIYVSNNNWIGFEEKETEHLKICRRYGAVYYVYRQEGELETRTRFLKIRVEGYTFYNSTMNDYKLIYEIFLFDDGFLYINIVQSPANISYIGVSSITDGSSTESLDIPANITPEAPVGITVRDAGVNQVVAYERYTPIAPVGLEISVLPGKTSYYGNEPFDGSGLVVSVVYADGNKKTVTDYEVSGFDSSIPGGRTVTVSRNGFTASFEIIVLEVAVTGIEFLSTPEKTVYNIGEIFKDKGLVLSLNLSNGESLEISGGYQVTGFDTTSSGVKQVNVIYGKYTIDFSITVTNNITEYIGSPVPEDIIATLDVETGLVIISGSGDMREFTFDQRPFKENRTDIKRVEIRKGVTSIGFLAFYLCYELTNVEISEGVSFIGESAFGSCSALKSIGIPASVTSIGTSAFGNCTSLTDIKISEGVSIIGTAEFVGCSALKSISIPASVTSIGNSAFSGCTSLTDIRISEGVSIIGEGVFSSCSALKSISIPASVTSIGNSAFAGCTELEEVAISEGLENIGDRLFAYCELLKNIVLPRTLKTIGQSVFEECKQTLESIYIKAGTWVNAYFADFVGLKSIRFGDGIETLPISMCAGCVNLAQVIMDEGVKIISEGVFRGCTSITDINLPSTITAIKDHAFTDCTGIKCIETPENVLAIGEKVFEGCENSLESICIRAAETIGMNLFFGFKALRKVHFGSGVKVLPRNICSGCTALADLIIEEGVETIDANAFYECNSLTSVTIPSTIRGTIDVNAFGECESLSNITFNTTKECNLSSAFRRLPSLEELVIPEIGEIDYFTFTGCAAIKTVRINYAKKINASAFSECTSLESAYLNAEQILLGAFRTTPNLKDVEFGPDVKFIAGFGWSGSGIEEIDIPENVETLGQNAFDGCPSLGKIRIYNPNIEIADEANTISDSATIYGYYGSTAESYAKKYGRAFIPLGSATYSIKILTPPTKTEYAVGEELDTTGLMVKLIFDTGEEKEITTYTLSGYNSSKTGQQLVTVTYAGATAGFYVFVGALLPTGVIVSRHPDKRVYAVGEAFDSTGLRVNLTYNSGKTEPVTDYVLSGFDSETVGIKTVRIAYTHPAAEGQVADILETSFTVTVTKFGSNPFESDTARKGMRIHWLDRPYTDVTSEEIQLDSFVLDQSICSDSSFRFGGCISSKFECKIFSEQFLAPDTYPDGKIQVYLQAGDEEVRIFTGVIDSSDRTDNLNIRRIVAYDELKTKGGINLKEFGAYVSKFSPGVDLLRKELLKYLGIEEIRTNLMYDAAMIPYNFDYSSLTALQLLKDICVNNMVWGWINQDGVFEYLKLSPNAYWQSGKHNYYTPEEVLTGLIKPATFKEGRIWYPYRFALNPDPYYPVDVGVEIPDLKAYEDNVYFIDNSPLVGDYDWISQVYREKITQSTDGGFGSTTYELAGPIVLGPHFEQDDYSHRYLAREYTCKVKGNPYRKIGTNIQFDVSKPLPDGRELTWTINSYIMTRKMTSSDGLFVDTYSARNGPYNPPAYGIKKEAKSNTRDIGKLKKTMPRWKVFDGSGQSTEIEVRTGNVSELAIMAQGQYDSIGERPEGTFYFCFEEE